MSEIKALFAREILDSRGNPTVEVDLQLHNWINSRASVPAGASTGAFEAYEMRDGDESRYRGLGVQKAVSFVRDLIGPALVGKSVLEQRMIDQLLLDLDGSENKRHLGSNAILGVSLAVAKAAAAASDQQLFQYLGGSEAVVLPVPMMNVINGGAHTDTAVEIQEFMILPFGAKTFSEALRIGVEVYHSLKAELKKSGMQTGLGDEGGFAPDLRNNREALDYLIRAITNAGFKPGEDVALALDVAATELFRDGAYHFEGKKRDAGFMSEYYSELISDYPLVSIEDPLDESDWPGWSALTEVLGGKVQLVGDDLFVTNVNRLQLGIERRAANSLLVKVNQIGTLTETLDAVSLARGSGYSSVLSHRSGETEDTSISDLAVATRCGQIKTGAPARSERVAKYNQLLRIEESLGSEARFAGKSAFSRFV